MKSYRGRAAQAYEQWRFRSRRGRAVDFLEWRLLERGLRLLESSCGRRARSLLDAPAGTGRMLDRLAAGSRSVVALDGSPDMLRLAEARGGAAKCVLGRVEAIPLDDKSLDAVVSVRLFGHLAAEEKVMALREFARVGRMGAVVFYAGDSEWLRFRRTRFRRTRAGRDPRNWYPVSDSVMRMMAHEAGLAAVARLRLLGPFAETRALVLRTIEVPVARR